MVKTYSLKNNNNNVTKQGRIQDFKLGGGGGALKKIAPSGGRREIFGVFRVKNHDFTPKNLMCSYFRGGARAGCAPPGSAPAKCTRRDYMCRLSIYTHEHFKQQNKIYMYQLKNGHKRVKLNVIIWSRAASNKCNIHAQEVQLKVCTRID